MMSCISSCYAVPPTVDVSSLRMCALTNGIQQPYALPPQSSCKKSKSSKFQLRSKQSSNVPSPENFVAIGGYFERYMYRVMALGWLKKNERKKMSNRPFQICHFKIVTTHCYCRLGQAALCTSRHEYLFPGNDTTVKMLIH